jgi:predicted methyltransferase
MRHPILAAAAAAVMLSAAAPSIAAPPASVVSALADPGRPAEDRARDAARRPADILAFAGVKPGQTVVDLIMGGGYFSRILAKAVEPGGKVYGYQPDEFIAYEAKYGADQKAVVGAYSNITALNGSLGALSIPEPVDVVFTAQNYHDFHLKAFPADTADKVNRAVFAALKPGGVYLVIDHHAAAGTGVTTSDSLHRIEAEAVKREVTAAGFTFDGELGVLRNPADPRTGLVFDPSIRGKTDQFVYRFKKPAK